MNDYVQQTWQRQMYANTGHGKAGLVVGWVLGVAAVIALVAYATQEYWYPYIASYI
ncbi:MAG: hypothetical protein H7Y02_06475 [Candidatus Obscuribacterales bacterium]|nr:hypothetical protein [Steroidobacteraceae bacterium]